MTIPYLPTPASPLVRLFKNDFVVAALIAVAASAATFALAYGLGWLTGAPNWFEVVAATLNYGATYLSIKQRRFAYTLGFVASAAWAVAFYQYNLLGSAMLSLYLVGQLIYGYFRWGPDGKTRPVHKFQWKYSWAYVLATAATYAGAYFLVTALGGSFAPLDASILVLTILAQFMLDNKVLSAWYVWTLVNIVGVILYATAGAPFAVVQQFLFGLANIWGFIAWRKSMQAEHWLDDKSLSDEDVRAKFDSLPDVPLVAPYAAADVEMTRKIYDAMPKGERLIKGEDGIKRLEVDTQNSTPNFFEEADSENQPKEKSDLTFTEKNAQYDNRATQEMDQV